MREDWATAEADRVARVVTGNTPTKKNRSYYSSKDYPFYKPSDLEAGVRVISSIDGLSEDGFNNARIAPVNTTLVTCIGATIGKSGLVGRRGAFNQQINGLIPFEAVDPRFIYYQVIGHGFQQQIMANASSTTLPILNKGKFSFLKFQVAPLPEQRAIVAKIEQLFSELDNGIANLQTARKKLDIYRQAVLKKAFEGELTKTWREQQKNLPSADELLEQIKAERQRHYDQQLADWKLAVKTWEANGKPGKKPTKPKEPKKTTPLTNNQKDQLFALSDGFTWLKIGDLTLNTEYGSSAKSLPEGDVPVLRMGNIQRGRFDWDSLVFSTNPAEIEQYMLQYDDVLFNRTNSPELVGKTAIYKGERPAIFAGYLIRVKQIPTLCSGDYLNYYLNSHPARVHGNSVKTDGVNQSNINGEKLKNYPLPFCSIQEQNEIVQEIESRLSVCDKLAETIDTSLQQAEALRQSILKRAFDGRLLTDSELAACRAEADWEPAEKLLERNQTHNRMARK